MSSHHAAALHIRKVSGTPLDQTLVSAVQALSARNIPSLVVGGYAVQENGYPRMTVDVDLLVPDVAEARGVLANRTAAIKLNLMPGGGSVGPGPVKLPMPTVVSQKPIVADLRTLITIKLSSYLGSPTSRLKDAADFVELIKANDLARNFSVDPKVEEAYQDGLLRMFRVSTADCTGGIN